MKKSINLITQYFPPDQAATGQLLNSLISKITEETDWNFFVNTGYPSYIDLGKKIDFNNIHNYLKYNEVNNFRLKLFKDLNNQNWSFGFFHL